LTQSVIAPPPTADQVATTTTLSLLTQSLPHGRREYVLVATVAVTGGSSSLAPTGLVVFRKNGRTFARARLTGGVARVALGRNRPGSKLTFVAVYQGSLQDQASTSLPFQA
jgi:hypothetical protein